MIAELRSLCGTTPRYRFTTLYITCMCEINHIKPYMLFVYCYNGVLMLLLLFFVCFLLCFCFVWLVVGCFVCVFSDQNVVCLLACLFG